MFYFQGFLNELFDLFNMKEIIYHGKELVMCGQGTEEYLRQETRFLQSQIRGSEDKSILYIPRITHVS